MAAATATFALAHSLLAAYGDAYETYRRSGLPFYLPRQPPG